MFYKKLFESVFNNDREEGGIQFKTGYLKDLLQKYPKIKSLRVPSWILQEVYYKPFSKDIACVALEGNIPVAIAVICVTGIVFDRSGNEEEYSSSLGLVNLFVDSWHREIGLASKTLDKVLLFNKNFKTLIAARKTRKMLLARGYEETGEAKYYIDASYFKKSE